MDKFHPKTFSGESRQGRSFHRLGVAIAGAILAVGLALIGAAISRLDLFETLGANTLAVVAGFALVLLAQHRDLRRDPRNRVGKSGTLRSQVNPKKKVQDRGLCGPLERLRLLRADHP